MQNDRRLRTALPKLEAVLTRGVAPEARFPPDRIVKQTVWVTMRDGTRLSTDLYLPPDRPAPVLVTRTPYGRTRRANVCLTFAQCGYVVVSQDCRGTGGSEPDWWEYYLYEPQDSVDCVDWLVRQEWCNGFIAGFGGSYLASTQWCMAAHPRMSTIVPEVGGLGVTFETARLYMFLNAYSRSVGKGAGNVPLPIEDMERQMLPETLAGGYFNEPLEPDAVCSPERRRRAWARFCAMGAAQRIRFLKRLFNVERFTYREMERLCTGVGLGIAYGAHSIPSVSPSELRDRIQAPALLVAGWYDWNLNDTLASWVQLTNSSNERVATRSRLLITPSAHNATGYREGREQHPELDRVFRTPQIIDVLLQWYSSMNGGLSESWPAVVYYHMGANEWRTSPCWPPPEVHPENVYLGDGGTLSTGHPSAASAQDSYVYDPADPTPTVGGSIVSYVYPPGSADVSAIQRRADVLTYTTPPLKRPVDVVGPLRLILYASSTAVDTDFCARLSDVFPDGRAIQLQNGVLRARYRDRVEEAQPLEPQRVYRLEIDMWATANRFQAGHRLRLDISSSDFPRYDRNSNCAGKAQSVAAVQTVYRQADYPSSLCLPVLGSDPLAAAFD